MRPAGLLGILRRPETGENLLPLAGENLLQGVDQRLSLGSLRDLRTNGYRNAILGKPQGFEKPGPQ